MIERIKDVIKYLIKSTALKVIIIKNSLIYNYRNNNKNNYNNYNKNILIIISRLHTGGAEKAAINIAEELSKKYSVKILIYSDRDKEEYECNVPVIEAVKHQKCWFKLSGLIREVRKIKKENNITHTISFCTRANLVNVASRYKDKTIISVRNYLSNTNETKMYKKYNLISCKLADSITSVSTLVKEDLIKNYKAKSEKITTIYNFIDEEKLKKYFNRRSRCRVWFPNCNFNWKIKLSKSTMAFNKSI